MKNFKNTLAIVALLAIGSASAKSLRRPTYDPSGAISQPVAQPSKTIKSQLLQTLKLNYNYAIIT